MHYVNRHNGFYLFCTHTYGADSKMAMIQTGGWEQKHFVDHHMNIKRAVHDLPAV